MNASVIPIVKSTDVPESFFSVRRFSTGLDVVPLVLEDVRVHGDVAVRKYAAQFDHANPEQFAIPKPELKVAELNLKKENPDLYDSLCRSRDLALQFASRQKESFNDFETELSPGLITGQRTIAVDRAGIYIPAGRFPLFSSVIMCTTPAKAAGVSEVILCTPPVPHPDPSAEGKPWADEHIMATASLCDVDRIFAIGGAQAIASMAYGTETVPRVNVIVGPGNKYVAAAKKLVYGEVGIDLIAGPTEVMVIADETATPAWIAADLLAQAEHDPDAQAVLVTTSTSLASEVQKEVERLVVLLPENAIARASFEKNGLIIIVKNLDEAASIANRKAPEHLELALDPGKARDELEREVHNYGSLFIGHRSAEVLGDYAAGLNHTLPTSGNAMFTGGLSVRHFLKTVTTLRTADTRRSDGKVDLSGWEASLHAACSIAAAEGLSGHAQAAACRIRHV